MPVFRKDQQKILFIHVPRTGGSSIERAFRDSGFQTLYLDSKVGRTSWNHVRRCTPQHMHAQMLDALFRVDRFDLVFMVVRDPMSRLKSEYLWRNRDKDFDVDGRSLERWARRSFAEYRSDPFRYDNHLRPQVEFELPGTRVFSYEDGLGHAVEELNRMGNLDLDPELPRVREGHTKTGCSSSDVEETPGLTALVRDGYGADLQRYGYPR